MPTGPATRPRRFYSPADGPGRLGPATRENRWLLPPVGTAQLREIVEPPIWAWPDPTIWSEQILGLQISEPTNSTRVQQNNEYGDFRPHNFGYRRAPGLLTSLSGQDPEARVSLARYPATSLPR